MTLSAVRLDADRIVLRALRDADRDRFIELRTDPEVNAHIGGPTPRQAVEQRLADIGGLSNATVPGVYAIADRVTDTFLGTVQLTRLPLAEPGHITPAGEELGIGYLLHRSAWGAGFAFEATSALLRSAAAELPDEPVLLITQSANVRSLSLARRLGFRAVSTFEAYDAEQTLSVAALHSFKA
ncbi:GNAT family N-acetyltransferase [Kutzneria sp. NPDC051319]|uniref:GNAT family N-acetyltransferase n=1 Tax=Kutzneria sp. NPDC051319 TaxID=3155047 RepID=UPI003413A632